MTMWTPVGAPNSSWISEAPALRIFSPLVFSHATFGGKLIFAVGSLVGIWNKNAAPSSTWTPE